MRINVRRFLLILVILFAACAALFAVRFFFRGQDMRQNLQPVYPPENAQILIFPIDNGMVTAGYQNATYLEKNKFPHYGIDITATHSNDAEILASGGGVVLDTEFCDNSLGNIAVVRYDDVFIPQTGETVSLIARYYHMASLLVQKGDVVLQGQVIGKIDRSHKWHNHIHLELDTDLDYPFNTPQVAEASSKLLIRFPADGKKMLEPLSILALSAEQHVYIHPDSDCCTEKDNPRFIIKK